MNEHSPSPHCAQSEEASLPDGDVAPGGQLEQAALAAADASLQVPGAQSWHEDPTWNLPATQSTHRDGPLYPSRALNCSVSIGTQASVKSGWPEVQEDSHRLHHR
jgi:hypothetical protein